MKMTTLILASLCAARISVVIFIFVCHGPDKANPQEPTIDTCKQCHDVKALVEKTKDVKPANPHMSPHYRDELECTNCHIMHGETENFCDQCHQFGYKVP